MTEDAFRLAGAAIILFGSLLILLGGVLLVRFPDVYSRSSGTSTAGTAGLVVLMLGAVLAAPGIDVIARAVIIIAAIIGTFPLSAHAISRFAYHIGIKPATKTSPDELADAKNRKEP